MESSATTQWDWDISSTSNFVSEQCVRLRRETALLICEVNAANPPASAVPAVKGLFRKPTYQQRRNLRQHHLDYSQRRGMVPSMGTEKSKSTSIRVSGFITPDSSRSRWEHPTHDHQEIGGRIPTAKVQGGSDGRSIHGCNPASLADAIDYDNLIAISSMMGSGGLIVMDEDNCMVDIAKFFLEFTVDESCGKCPPRVGNKRLYEMLDKVAKVRRLSKTSTRWKNFATIKRTRCADSDKPRPTCSFRSVLPRRVRCSRVDHKCPPAFAALIN
ncbi:MAG: NADH-ubiquinone oxidoreductase-F iron-sulfur binding region domain-containing protein [Christensenellales bacterium]